MEQKIIVSIDTLNKVLLFLSERPFKEVAELISEVQKDVSSNMEEHKKLQKEEG